MTISTTIIKNSYSGNGSTSVFNYTFKISAESEMEVIIRSSNGTETVKTITTHYTVSGVGNAGGGTVTFTGGNIPVTGETVILRRDTAQTQTMDLIDNDPMSAETIETAHDKAIAIAQELQEQIDRSIKLSRTNTMTSTEFTVDAASRSNKILAFDSAGEIAVTQELGTYQGNWSSGTSYYVRDLIKDTSNNNIYICITAHTSSGSQPISSNTDSAKWSLIVDAASATTSATTATTQAGIATTKASEASASASAALTSENNAATSETNASNSATTSANEATASANSATAAAGSANAAAATFDLFDDAYLGAKASNPTLDNDGDALQDGALYFDTTNDVMKVYNLANTTWYQLTPTVSNQTNINTVAAIAADVTQAASDSADIQTVAGDSADIQTLADIEDGTVATNAISNAGNNTANITTVAGAVSPTNYISIVAGQISPTNNISTVAGISADITAVANDATDIGVVASDLSSTDTIGTVAADLSGSDNIGTVATNIVNVNQVGSNIGTVNEFGERYRVSASAPTTSLDVGDLYYDTTTDAMKVYGSSGWQNAGSSVNGTSQRYNYTATSGQTTFSGSDNNGNTLNYDAGYIDVYLNGIKLLNGTDVTVTSGNSIVLSSGANLNDVIDITAYGTFSVASLDATNLTSGTIPDARFPATLPALNGSALTALNATNIASGTLASDRLPTVPTSKGGTGLTAIGTANQVLAVNSGATALEYQTIDLTNLSATNLTSGTIPDARFPATLPAISGTNLTNLDASDLASGTVPIARIGSGTKNSTTFLRGDNTFAEAGGGKLEQIVISSAISTIGTTSTSFVNLSADLTVTITPTASSSSIFIMVFGSGSTGGGEAQYEINRSGTQVAYTGFAPNNNGPIYIFGSDSPNTTSSVTYNIRAKNVGGASGHTTYWNGSSPRKSWIIAMEIKA